SDSQSFGHGVPFWKTNVPFILPHLSRYYQLNFLKCIIGPYRNHDWCIILFISIIGPLRAVGCSRARRRVEARFIAPDSTSEAMSSLSPNSHPCAIILKDLEVNETPPLRYRHKDWIPGL
ncbi:MAG TPA: hypothetical protein VKR42_02600, partial [Ktedonobacteraceae bacterium]|nr:hypothetical protein [Ktedonobacteraceae bacterium]